MFHEKINYFDWAIFNSFLYVYRRVAKGLRGFRFSVEIAWCFWAKTSQKRLTGEIRKMKWQNAYCGWLNLVISWLSSFAKSEILIFRLKLLFSSRNPAIFAAQIQPFLPFAFPHRRRTPQPPRPPRRTPRRRGRGGQWGICRPRQGSPGIWKSFLGHPWRYPLVN